jgi:hypothetical protein
MNMPKHTGSIRHRVWTRLRWWRASMPAMKVPARTQRVASNGADRSSSVKTRSVLLASSATTSATAWGACTSDSA